VKQPLLASIGDTRMDAHVIVKELKVEGYRGFREASLTDFTGINVFVGRNGSGKSSILEALYIALKQYDGLSYVVRRRGWFGLASVDALFHGKGEEIKIEMLLGDGSREEVTIKRDIPIGYHLDMLRVRGLNVSELYALNLTAKGKVTGSAMFYIDSKGKHHPVLLQEKVGVVSDATFIDWNSVHAYGTPEAVYSVMVKQGGEEAKESVVKTLQTEYRELRDITVLYTHGEWVLHLTFKDRAIPYYVVGDGIRYALMYLMSVFTPREAVLLMEEPELHTHPSLMRVVVDSILRSYRERGNQVFLSTHSLELIKIMLEQAEKLELKDQDLKIYRTVLENGILHAEEYTLSEASDAVRKLEWDLRR